MMTAWGAHDGGPDRGIPGRLAALAPAADRRLEALAALPEVIRYSPTDADLEHRVLQVLLDGLPHARAAAVVQFLRDQSRPPEDLKIAVRAALSRTGAAEVRPSRRLVYN